MSFLPTFERFCQRGPESPRMAGFSRVISSDDRGDLEAIAQRAASLTRRHFGRTMRLFAPLYLSNECINNCRYCGFSRDNTSILRVTLSVDEVVAEARHLAAQGFRHLLLVAGEHPKFVSDGYLEDCIRAVKPFIPQVAIEVGPMETPEYARMVKAGAEGLVVYQETYDRDIYQTLHTAGPKRDFDWRLECPERAHAGGFRRIGIGALFGLADWRTDALRLAAHLDYLTRTCWNAQFTVAMPRIRPAAGGFVPDHFLDDAGFVRLLCAFRLAFPEIAIVMSTREPPAVRDALLPLGITSMSAGSHTEPGGYTNQGTANLHHTVRGRHVDAENTPGADPATVCHRATEQFGIADTRSPAEIAALLRTRGFDPVWKDWDEAILSEPALHP